MGKKRCYFKKQSGGVIENKFLWKKQTQKQTGPYC
jgi:hypothetical protein